MPAFLTDPGFWLDLGQIMLVNIVLSGDNAVVIALAARALPEAERNRAIVIGSMAAILMRVSLTFVALQMLQLPFLKFFGSLLLMWIAIKLLVPQEGSSSVKDQNNLFSAVRTILIADLVMSLDNVLAVAAAAGGDQLLLITGLAISIPIVIFGSTLILRLMERHPVIISFGAGMLGYVAGEMLVTEPAFRSVDFFSEGALTFQVLPIATAGLVLLIGRWQASQQSRSQKKLIDLAIKKTKKPKGLEKKIRKSKPTKKNKRD